MTDFLVAFVGLPSSGKSSIINSLLFKRKLQSGVCRTTTDVNIIDELVLDDKNNKFRVIDLPGICDSEENNSKFNELTYAHITNASLIIWVSDVNKAFITTHEVDEYNKLKKYVKEIEYNTGTLYHIAIMLSKCDKNCDKKKKTIKITNTTKSDELEDSDEDTDISDLIIKVKEKFPSDDIIMFNAYGRSFYHNKSSDVLKKFVKKMVGVPSEHNIDFNINKYIVGHEQKQTMSYYNVFLKTFEEYLQNPVLFEKLMTQRLKITDIQKINHYIEFVKKFKFAEMTNLYPYLMFGSNDILSELQSKDQTDVNLVLLGCLIYMLTTPYMKLKANNYVKDYTEEEVIDDFSKLFNKLDIKNQNNIIVDVIINNTLLSIEKVVLLLNKLFPEHYKFYELGYETMFNEYSNSLNNTLFSRYAYIIKQYIDISKFQFNYLTIYPFELLHNFNEFVESLLYDNEYILLNKIQIAQCLINKQKIECHFGSLLVSLSNYKRFIMNPKYRATVNSLWLSIYSNILLECDIIDYSDFVPISVLELNY